MKHPCPHCYAENEAFGAQRCTACGLTMVSDQEYALLQGPVQEKWHSLHLALQDDSPPLPLIQPLWQELQPYGERFPFLQTWLKEQEPQITAWLAQDYQLRQRRVLHLTILLFLMFAPLLAAWWQAPAIMTGLLLLPVLGWAWLGVWPLFRKRQ